MTNGGHFRFDFEGSAIAGCAPNFGRLLTCLVDGHPRVGPQAAVATIAGDCHTQDPAARPWLAILAVGLHDQAQAAAVLVRARRQLGEVADPQPLLSPVPFAYPIHVPIDL